MNKGKDQAALTVSVDEARCLRDLGRLRGIGDTEFGKLLTAIADCFDPPKEPEALWRRCESTFNEALNQKFTSQQLWECVIEIAREGTVDQGQHDQQVNDANKFMKQALSAEAKLKASVPIAEMVALLERMTDKFVTGQVSVYELKEELARYPKKGFRL